MRVNIQVEPLVREALSAAVNRDAGQSGQALLAIQTRGDAAVSDAVNLAVAISKVALFDIYDGTRPSGQQLDDLAASFAEMEEWAEFDQQTARRFLAALTDDQPIDRAVDAEVLVRLVFVVAAWLLSAFLTEGEHWYNFLDQILDGLEAAPAGA